VSCLSRGSASIFARKIRGEALTTQRLLVTRKLLPKLLQRYLDGRDFSPEQLIQKLLPAHAGDLGGFPLRDQALREPVDRRREVQLAADPQKRLSWPAYVTVARAVHGCPAALLVVAPDPGVAGWCAEPIVTGVPGFVLRPPVLRRTAVPVVTDREEAVRRPELGVLSAMAHGETAQGETIAAAVLPAIQGLDDDRVRFYYDLVYNSLNEAARRTLEAMMKGYEYQSDFAKKYVAQGRAEGRTEEAANAVLSVLQARGLVVPDAARERILAQKDTERLERWLKKAVVAPSVAAVLDDPN
jgi:hypothetical protein